MSSFRFFYRFVLLSIVLLGLRVQMGAAQTIRSYASQVISATNTANPEAATGSDPTTQATLRPSTVVGAAKLNLGFAAVNPVGSKVGLLVNSGGLLAAAALSGVVINTYLSPSTTPQETRSVGQLLSLQLLNASQRTVELTASKPFDQIELVAAGVVNAYDLVLAYADAAAPLPVSLTAFAGKATSSGVQLSWQTATELNSSYFAVERATGSVSTDFAELGRVAGAGSSTQAYSYEFVDATPAPLGHYRLRQVDADGQVHYSPVVAVRAEPATRLVAYPSPATTTLFVVNPTETHLGLFNSQGQLLRQTVLGAGQQPLDVSSLPAGVYYLRATATGQSTRFVKTGGQ